MQKKHSNIVNLLSFNGKLFELNTGDQTNI